MHPVDLKNSELTSAANWAMVRAMLLAAALYVAALLPMLVIFWSSAFAYACLPLAAFIFIGAFYPHDYSSELGDILSPFDSDSASGYQANRAVNRVAGPVVLLTQLILGVSRNIKLFIRLRKARWPVGHQDLIASTRVISKLQKLGMTSRFHEISHLMEDSEVVERLTALGILWQKVQEGKVLVGLNRAYDVFVGDSRHCLTSH